MLVALLLALGAHPAIAASEMPQPQAGCVNVRPFLGGGRRGCRVAVTEGPAQICIKEQGEGTSIAFKSEKGETLHEYAYDKKDVERGFGHREIFYRSSKNTGSPEVRIGLSDSAAPGSSVIVIGKARYCLPPESVQALLK